MNLFLAAHNDDESLFGAFTLIREKPLVAVVTDSYIQPNRGDIGCSAEQRWQETQQALDILGCSGFRCGLRDDSLTEDSVKEVLKRFHGFQKVYAPAIQGGNWQHDFISKVASEVFKEVIYYTTYTKTELWTKGNIEIIPTQEEINLKNKALDCYKSQINLGSTRPHFEAVRGKSEWLL